MYKIPEEQTDFSNLQEDQQNININQQTNNENKIKKQSVEFLLVNEIENKADNQLINKNEQDINLTQLQKKVEKQTFCEDEWGSQGSDGEFDDLIENILLNDNEDDQDYDYYEDGSGSMPKSANSLQDDPETKMILEEIKQYRQSQQIHNNQYNQLNDDSGNFLQIPQRNKEIGSNNEISSSSSLQASIIKNLDNGEIKSENDLSFQNQKFVTFKKKKNKKSKKKNWTKYWQEAQRFHDDLIEFCHNKDLDGLSQHLNQKQYFTININCKYEDNKTIIHILAELDATDILIFLKENFKDLNINALTQNNQNALHKACIKGHLQIIKKLIEFNIELNQQDEEFNTPLHIASQYGQYEIVQCLLEQKQIKTQLKNYQGNLAEDISLNKEIFNLFQEYNFGGSLECLDDLQKKQSLETINKNNIDKYKRFQIGDQIYRKNSRTDQVQNILNMVSLQKKQQEINQQQSLQNSKINNSQKCLESNNISKVSSQNSQKFQDLSPKTNAKSIHSRFDNIMQYTQQEFDTVGPKDFIYLDKLGKGSFGNVYLVQKKGEEQYYAMKTLRKDRVFSKNQNLLKYVQAEQSILSTMNHPFIVGLKYAFQTENKLYLVMQYCPGGDMEGVLIRRGKLKEDLAKMYLSEILLALQALHKEKIVFRDLKPQNVVIDEDGHALLIDFGLSRQGVQKKNVLTSFCGSLAYLAPEMLDRKGHNFTIDYYLFGLLIYELLSGYPPFYTDNKKQLFQNIRNQKLKFPRYFSKDAKDIIEQLMQRNPEERLGAIGGAEDIKRHSFFSNINWDKVYKKQNKVPKPHIQTNYHIHNPYQNKMYVTFSEQDQVITEHTNNYIPNWAFVNNKDINQQKQ